MSPKQCFITNNSLVLNLNETKDEHKKYIYYFLKTINKAEIVTWSAQPQVTINNVISLEIPLPPLPLQHLIVSEIEKQFSRLDDGLSSLLKIRQNLKSYRASILKSAVEGKLTEEWRKEQKDIEPASILLARILEERKRKFLSENPGKKYKEPEGIYPQNFPNIELPEGWCFAKLDCITSKITDWFHNTPKVLHEWEHLYIMATHVKDDHINYDSWMFVWEKDFNELYNKTRVENWDILIVNIWAGTGDSALVKVDTKFVFKNVAILKPLVLDSKYLHIFIRSFKRDLTTRFSKWWAQPFLSLEVLRKLLIPLPPLSEQQKIVEEVEYRLSIVDELEQTIEAGIKKAENLKQAILKKAFNGELVKEEEK